MNFKLAVLLLAVVATVSANMYVVTFYGSDKCDDNDVSGGYIEDRTGSNCSTIATSCTKAGNVYVKDSCVDAIAIKVRDIFTGVIAYADDKCEQATTLWAARDTDKCYSIGDAAFSLSACNSKGEIAVKTGSNCNDLTAYGTATSSCAVVGNGHLSGFCATAKAPGATKSSDAQTTMTFGALACLAPIFALF